MVQAPIHIGRNIAVTSFPTHRDSSTFQRPLTGMQTAEESTKRRPRTNRIRRRKNIDKSTPSGSQNTMGFEPDTAKGLTPPTVSRSQGQGQGQPSNETLDPGPLVKGNATNPSSTLPAKPAASQNQAQLKSQSRMSLDSSQHSFTFENSTSQPPAPHSIRIPSPPPFSSVKFATIGRQPELLKRFSDFAPGIDTGPEVDVNYQSASPEPTTSMGGTASEHVPGSGLGLGRLSLLQALGGSDLDMDANMDVDPSMSDPSSTSTAVHVNGAAQSQSCSLPGRTQYSSAGDRSARSRSQSRRNSSGSNSNSTGNGNVAIRVNTSISTSANTGNSTLNGNGNDNGSGNVNSTLQRDSSAATPELLYPSPSRPTSVADDNPHNPNLYKNIATGSGGTNSMSNLLALRNVLEQKTAGLKIRAARERERDAASEREKGSRNSDSGGLPSGSGSASSQDAHMREQSLGIHSDSESNAGPNSSQNNITSSQLRPTEDSLQSPTHLDAPSQAQFSARHARTEVSPVSHTPPTPTPSSHSISVNAVAGDNISSPSLPFSQAENSSSHINTLSQIPSDALDSALSSAKQWFDDMSRARSEIQALLARATVAESAAQSLRSELTHSQSESASLREQVSSSSVLLTQAQTEKIQLQERVEALQEEIEQLKAREEEERSEREIARQEVEEAVKVGEGIMELVDGWVEEKKNEQGQLQEQEQSFRKVEKERIVQAETEARARLDKEQEDQQCHLASQLQLQGQQEQEQLQQREQDEADAASFAKKHAEVLKEKGRANQENVERIRSARAVRSISRGVRLSTSSSPATDAAQADDRNNIGNNVHMPAEDMAAVLVPAPPSTQASAAHSVISAGRQSLPTPSLPRTSHDPSKSPAAPSTSSISYNVDHLQPDSSALSSPSAGSSGELPPRLGPVRVGPATHTSNLREARLAAVADTGLKPAHVETENKKVNGEADLQEQVDLKMEDADDDAALASSYANVTGSTARRDLSSPPTVQTQVESDTTLPLPRRPSSYNQRGSNTPSSEHLPPRPADPLPLIIPARGPIATPMSSQASPSSGPLSPLKSKPKLPKFTRNRNTASDAMPVNGDPQYHPVSRDGRRPLPVSASFTLDEGRHGEQDSDRVRIPEPVIKSPLPSTQGYDRTERSYLPPPRNVGRQQREQRTQYPPPGRRLTPPPAMPYKRVSDHYSPPPPSAKALSRARCPLPPSPGPSARIPESRKRRRSTYLPDVPDDEYPARRPWADGDRAIYERPPAPEARHEYTYADDAQNGPRTPPRPAPWERTPEPEPQPQDDPRSQQRSPSPTFRGGRTVRISNVESYRPAYDPEPKESYEASPSINVRLDHPGRQDATHASETYKSNPSVSVSGTLSSRMDIDYSEVSVDPTQRHSSPPQESANRTLLDRMSDSQRPPPSEPSFQSHGYPQIQTSGNNNYNRRISNQSRGNGQRGQTRGGRQARGRGNGGGSVEYSNLERQTLAARISGGSTLQDRLS